MVLLASIIRDPAGDGQLSVILRDAGAAAAVAVAVLGSDGHYVCTYDLTDRESFALVEAADLMRRTTGKPIRYEVWEG